MITGQRWGKKKPTQPGWYWYRDCSSEESVVLVYDGPDGRRYMCGPNIDHASFAEMDLAAMEDFDDNPWTGGEWQGPITPHDDQEGG